jgi:hypothetical protein
MKSKHLSALALASLVAAAGCARPADVNDPPAGAGAEAAPIAAPRPVEQVTVGSEVEVVRRDGSVVRGTLAGRDSGQSKLADGATSRTVPRAEMPRLEVPDAPRSAPERATFREFTLPEGTRLRMRLGSAVGSDTSRVEDAVEATLTQAVLVDGVEVLPAGSFVRGEVAAVERAGKVKGRAMLALRFTSVDVDGRDERSSIVARTSLRAPATKREDAAKIGIPAAGGAILGGIFGGKKGAAIGGAVGGGGGTAVVLTSRGDEVRLARGAALTVTLDQASDVRVPTKGS